MGFSIGHQRRCVHDVLAGMFEADTVGTSEASSTDGRRTLDEERVDHFLEGVFSDASSAGR